MKKTCAICRKTFDKKEELNKFVVIPAYGANKPFVICTNDVKRVVSVLEDMRKDRAAYIGHKEWLMKEQHLLQEAKKIYASCTCHTETKKEIKKMGDKIYDHMCEKCWEKFRIKEAEYKAALNEK